jgi:S-formylglutathione hydrolase
MVGQRQFSVDQARVAIVGHSMGGHGALILVLRHPDVHRSMLAFAPISPPMCCPWGEKASTGYLRMAWQDYDA